MEVCWKELIEILPAAMRSEVDKLKKEGLLELRLRIGQMPQAHCLSGFHSFGKAVNAEELKSVVNLSTHFSPWTSATSSQGYITAPGGHRIGICGEAICLNDRITGFRSIDSLCIRVCRDVPGAADSLDRLQGNILIIGAPGWGKTTLLRDLCRWVSRQKCVAVVDERQELFPQGFQRGEKMDVLLGCGKQQGMEMVLRSMGPEYIAVDEITGRDDCAGILRCIGCGVRLLATAHASSMDDFRRRPLYQELIEAKVFDWTVVMNSNRQYHVEAFS